LITKVITERSGHRVPFARNTPVADASLARMDHRHVLWPGSGRHVQGRTEPQPARCQFERAVDRV